jgi:hypothetical protein
LRGAYDRRWAVRAGYGQPRLLGCDGRPPPTGCQRLPLRGGRRLEIEGRCREFVDAHGRLLGGAARRLATVDSIGSGRFDELNDAQIAAVVGDCPSYFDRNPYRVWFDPLDRLLRDALGVSYYEGTACHLDLVQWATDPVWGKITDAGVRKALLEDGKGHLAEQLTHSNVRLVLLNGRQVIDQVQAVGLASLTEVDRLPLGRFGCRLVRGETSGIVFVGWSVNLQSSRGVTAAFKMELARWLSGNAADAEPDICAPAPRDPLPAGVMLAEDGHLRPGLVVHGKQELLQTLAQWLRDSSAATIGDVATFGGRAHLHLHLDGIDAVLNADTKRAAVNTYVQIADRDGPDVQWQVIANRRGVVNKVLPTLTINALPGWYCYLTNPLSAPERL